MAKVAIKSEKLSPFGGIFPIMEQFDSKLSSVIDSTLGMRCRLYGYQYSEIIRSLMSVYFCGGSCIEDDTTHLMYHLSLHPTLRTRSFALAKLGSTSVKLKQFEFLELCSHFIVCLTLRYTYINREQKLCKPYTKSYIFFVSR